MICPSCNSDNVRGNGKRTTAVGETVHRYVCNSCKKGFSRYGADTVWPMDVSEEIFSTASSKRLIVTSAKNGSTTNLGFLRALEKYAKINNAEILVIPVHHKNVGQELDPEFDEEIQKYLFNENKHYGSHRLKILGALKIASSVENPLAGIDAMSKGNSLIVGHPQVQLKTLARVNEKYPAIVTTTGSISEKDYTSSKSGTKADFNHSFSALVVEFDDGFVHLRHLNYDSESNGFNDLDMFYSEHSCYKMQVKALVTGDEHVMYGDKVVANVTYHNEDSICNTLQPDMLIRHDVLDAYSISHHHKKDTLKKYRKYVMGLHYIEKELKQTIDFINNTTPEGTTSYIVGSNHNEHLTRWLNECDPRIEPWNAKVFHNLMYKTLCSIEEGKDPDAFQLYCDGLLNTNVKFIGRGDPLSYKGIMFESHGDIGINGSIGSRKQFSMLPTKSIIGHSHSPGIEKGCYQVGTSSKLNLEYNKGASSWHHTHCVVHMSGKRQLLFITNGKYRL
jgi:hypothetical protein